MTAFVVEAKKIGSNFGTEELKRKESLRGRVLKGELGAAIQQARDYAIHKGIPFAVVTNGREWVVFPAQRVDQTPSEDSHAVTFQSLKSVLVDEVDEFCGLLERDSVISGSLEIEFWGRLEDQVESRRISDYYKHHFSKKRRNQIYPFIEDAVLTAFTEEVVKNDPELLEKCYVKTPERARFDRKIQLYIQRPNVELKSSPLRPIKGKRSKGLEQALRIAKSNSRPVSMLVLGTVGSGKTTFLDYTRNVSSRDYFFQDQSKPYPHWIQLDMRRMTPDEDVTGFIMQECLDYIKSSPFLSDYERCIQHAYKDEIDSLLRGPLFLLSSDEGEKKRRITDLIVEEYSSVSPYVERILNYASKNAPVFLVVDNVDQFEDQGAQELIFGVSISLANRMGLNLILAMRDATFVNHRRDPTFDAFDYDPIYIDPPNISAVLSRRFFISKELLRGKSASFVGENGARVHVEDLSTFVDVLSSSVLATEVGRLIEVMASSDVRLALRMTREFVQHGYTAPEKALRVKNYTLPRHEALRAILLGNDTTYSDSTSVVRNPFDSKLSKTSAQFLRIFILNGMVRRGSDVKTQYVDGGEVWEILRGLGFADSITLDVMSDLFEARFINTRSQSDVTKDASFLATRLGGYIVRDLIANFTFLENVLVDTFISDDLRWNKVKSFTDQIYSERNMMKKFRSRKNRVQEFFDFCSISYDILRQSATSKGLPPEWCNNPFEDMRETFVENLSRATRSAERTASNTK